MFLYNFAGYILCILKYFKILAVQTKTTFIMASDALLSIDIHLFDSLNLSSSISLTILPSDLLKNVLHLDQNFSLMHINARSLYNKMDAFGLLLNDINLRISIIGVSETWLDDTSSQLVSMSGYNFICKNRKN